MECGSLLDDPTGEASQIQLSHEEVSWEYYSGHVFSTLELVPVADRHHGTTLQICGYWISVQLDSESRSCFLFSTHWQAKEEAILLAILLEEVRDRSKE